MSVRGWAVGVVVPACNEELTIAACIDSIFVALASSDAVAASWVVVIADSCQDQTVERARTRMGERGEVVSIDAASAGVARRLGVERVLSRFRSRADTGVWIANTDADSAPHPDWISQQLALANQDYCGVAGIVQVTSIDGLPPEVVEVWRKEYLRGTDERQGAAETPLTGAAARVSATRGDMLSDGWHPHVHGANLGFRADAYLDAGGWSNLALAEDHCLWRRVQACGWRVVSSIASVVTTSGRLNGRASGGFADTLRQRVGLLCA